MNNEMMKALQQFYNEHKDLIEKKTPPNEEELKQFIDSLPPEQIFKIILADNGESDYSSKQTEPMKAIATTPDTRNNILRTPYGDIPTMTIGDGYYKQLYDNVDESPIPKTKKEINIRRESLVSIFENRAKFLLKTSMGNQMDSFADNLISAPKYSYAGYSRYAAYCVFENMEFLKSLDFYFQYNLTDSMLCDLTNQACSYVYDNLTVNLSDELNSTNDIILQIVNYYGQLFWEVLIQLNREAHDYYYSMGIPDFQEPKKLD